MQREIFLSSLVFILSSLGAFFSYYTIIKEIRYDNRIASDIFLGEYTYKVLNSGHCIGNIKYSLESTTDNSKISSEGSFNLELQGRRFPITYNFESTFNSIGQMGGTVLKVNLMDKFIILGALNIDPIKLSIKSNLLNAEREFRWQITGPIELKKESDNRFYLSGISFGRIKKENIALLKDNPLLKLPFNFELSPDRCQEQNFFDITPYIENAREIFQSYAKL